MADQFEYRLNATYTTKRMPVPFVPNVVFIYNPSNSWLYLNTTTYAIPTATAFDLSVPPESYLIFVPYTPNTEYGALLVPPSGNPILWDCWIEFRRGEKELMWDVKPDFPVIQPLRPLPDPSVSADFTYEVVEARGWLWDFTLDSYIWYGAGLQGAPSTYVPGSGWVSAQFALTPESDTARIALPPASFSGVITGIIAQINDTHSTGVNTWSLISGTGAATIPTTLDVYSGSPTNPAHGSIFISGALAGSGAATRLQAIITNFLSPTNTDEPLYIEYIAVEGTFTVPPSDGEAINIAVQFTDLSAGAVAAWLWDFGDGFTDTVQNPEHVYSYAGVYTVTLYAIGVYGTISQFTQSVYVNTVAPEVLPFV